MHALPQSQCSHSGLGHGGGSVGLEALVGPLVCEQSQGHGVHGRL